MGQVEVQSNMASVAIICVGNLDLAEVYDRNDDASTETMAPKLGCSNHHKHDKRYQQDRQHVLQPSNNKKDRNMTNCNDNVDTHNIKDDKP